MWTCKNFNLRFAFLNSCLHLLKTLIQILHRLTLRKHFFRPSKRHSIMFNLSKREIMSPIKACLQSSLLIVVSHLKNASQLGKPIVKFCTPHEHQRSSVDRSRSSIEGQGSRLLPPLLLYHAVRIFTEHQGPFCLSLLPDRNQSDVGTWNQNGVSRDHPVQFQRPQTGFGSQFPNDHQRLANLSRLITERTDTIICKVIFNKQLKFQSSHTCFKKNRHVPLTSTENFINQTVPNMFDFVGGEKNFLNH